MLMTIWALASALETDPVYDRTPTPPDLPAVVRNIEQLTQVFENESNSCSGKPCISEYRGEYFLLDLSGLPTWRETNSFLHVDEGWRDLPVVYVKSAYPHPSKPDEYGSERKNFGVLFDRKMLPRVKSGAVMAANIGRPGEPFQFNGRRYTLHHEIECRDISFNNGGTAFDAEVRVTLELDGVRQNLDTGLKGHAGFDSAPTCAEAKELIPHFVSFDFAGDLDGDGKLDLVYFGNHGSSFPTVYLSSLAGTGELVRIVRIDLSC